MEVPQRKFQNGSSKQEVLKTSSFKVGAAVVGKWSFWPFNKRKLICLIRAKAQGLARTSPTGEKSFVRGSAFGLPLILGSFICTSSVSCYLLFLVCCSSVAFPQFCTCVCFILFSRFLLLCEMLAIVVVSFAVVVIVCNFSKNMRNTLCRIRYVCIKAQRAHETVFPAPWGPSYGSQLFYDVLRTHFLRSRALPNLLAP